MKVDTMRKIDRWVGIPLTFLMTIGIWLIEKCLFFRFKRSTPDVSRTLFVELSEMGSAIIVDPAMRKLKQNGAELYFVIFKDNVKSLHLLNTVPEENIYTLRSDNIISLLIDSIKFMFWCRKINFTCVIDLELFSRATALLTAASLAPARIGYATLHDEGCYRGDLLTHPVRYNAHVHIGINFVSLVNTALGLNNTAYPTHRVNDNELELAKASVATSQKETVEAKIRGLYPAYQPEQRIFLINPNASDLLPQRRWPVEKFAEVIKFLLEKHNDALIIITGAPAEREMTQGLCDQVSNTRCVNSAGVFQFDELVPLYSISTMMLTNDSGPAHFAAVTDLKVFVLFGPETPHLYLPLGGNAEPFYLQLPCSPCVSAHNHRKTSCTARPCITEIPPSMVSNRIHQYLTS